MAARLQASKFRTITPWLHGFGATRLHSSETLRVGPVPVPAQDATELIDALGIERCTIVGRAVRSGFSRRRVV